MSNQESRLDQLLLQLKAVTEQILQLPFTGEHYDTELDKLQAEQQHLRKEIELEAKQPPYSQRQKQLLQQCLELEQNVHAKIESHKQELEAHLNKLRAAARLKSSYGHSYIQAEGYFIDKQK